MQFSDFRRDYTLGGLRRDMLLDCPVAQFEHWQEQAIAAGLADPTAASLATVETNGELWQRIVLLKQILDGGFVFFTNYNSHKAQALQADQRASLLFPWNEIDRQVTVSGRVERVAEAVSDAYFASRPRESQIGAWTSAQSSTIESRDMLEQQFAATLARFGDGPIPRPPHWGGFRLTPLLMEFWQGGKHRLHDRFRYTRDGDQWHIERLQP
jgi:pyridoxamine 5'-phosphate oxidase